MVSDRYPRRDGTRRQTTPSSNNHFNGHDIPSDKDEGPVTAISCGDNVNSIANRRSARKGKGDSSFENQDFTPHVEGSHLVTRRSVRRSYSPHPVNGVSPKDPDEEPPRRRTRRSLHGDNDLETPPETSRDRYADVKVLFLMMMCCH